jgi:hypothetical protein
MRHTLLSGSFTAVLALGFLGVSAQSGEPTTHSLQHQESIPSSSKDAVNVALLIGINSYPNLPPNKQLTGCVNDVLLMEKLLIKRFGFRTENISKLVDEQATKANIESAFREFLVEKATPEGQALFYYSGHGGRMTDLNGDEMDGFDETMVPYDSRDAAHHVLDIEDETLGMWIEGLTKQCKNVTVILDCCHSGSGTRGGLDFSTDAHSRTADTLVLDLPKAKQNDTRQTKGENGFLPPNPNYVLISGSNDAESSWEIGGNGALTWALNDVLWNCGDLTYREIMYKVADAVTSRFPYQHPQIEGGRRDAHVFGRLEKVEPYLTVVQRAGNRLQLSGGSAHEVTSGSVYAIYKPGATNKQDAAKYLGRAIIGNHVDALTSWADKQDPKADIPLNATAFEVSHRYGDMQLLLRLEIENDASLLQEFNDALAQYKQEEDLVKIVGKAAKYDLRLCLGPDHTSLLLVGPEGRELKAFRRDTTNVRLHVMGTLSTIARWWNLFDLRNRSDLNVAMTLRRWRGYDSKERRPVDPIPISETAGGERVLYDQDIINVSFRNLAQQKVYCYLFDLGTDGSVRYLYPGRGAKDSPLPPGDSVVSYAMRVSLPEGMDALKLIATTTATDFSVLEQAGYRAVARCGDDDSGLNSPLGRLLNLAYGGTRNAEVLDAVPIENWTTAMVTFLIKPKGTSDSGK